ncbi:unnamed protein product [Caenorhabditis brenneri]
MSTFPLFRLPLVALAVVISHFHLNHLSCTVWGSNLTNLEVNQYLKHWKMGKFPKLKVAYFEMEDINLEVLLDDLNAVNFPHGVEKTFKDASNGDVLINCGFDIQMENGTLATIVHQGGNFISKWFYMVVCVILSFCSHRAQRIAKLLRKKNPKTSIEAKYHSIARVDLKDTFLEDLLPKFSVEAVNKIQYSQIDIIEKSLLSEEDQEIELVRVGGSVIPFSKSSNCRGEVDLNFYFEERFEGLKVILEYVTWFFDVPIHTSVHSSRMYPDQIRKFLDYAMTRQYSIEYCYVECEQTSEEQIRNILDVCDFAESLFMLVHPSQEFRHQFTFEKDSIVLRNAFWFNLENLFNINCRVCRVFETKLTNLQMNQYLKRWMAGSFEKLERLSIEMENINLDVLLADLNAVNFPEGERRTYKDESKRTITIGYGFDIRRNDNTVATIVHHGGNIITKRFLMIIWLK